MKNFYIHFFQLLIIAGYCLNPDAGRADIYKYVDSRGIIHLTNIPNHNGYKLVLQNSDENIVRENKYDHIIKKLCKKYALDVPLIKAVIKAESDFNPSAVSKKGAQGLMQLMPEKVKELSVADPFDPYQNIEGGIRYLRGLFEKFKGDISLVLAAYNAGENAVLKKNQVPPFKETQDYIKKVLQHKKKYQ